MSQVRRYAQAQSVTTIHCANLVSGGVRLAGAAAALAAQGFGVALRTAYAACTATAPAQPKLMQSGAVLAQQPTMQQAQLARTLVGFNLSAVDTIKVSTLAELAATPYFVHTEVLTQPLAALQQATTLAQAEQARQRVVQAAQQSHREVFVQTLAQAGAAAAIAVGFTSVTPLPPLPGLVRMAAQDPAGRGLVLEVADQPNSEPSIAAEVVGVTDNSCDAILNAFTEALAAQGVRTGPPQRKATGGVVELSAAREFVRRKLTPPAAKVRPVPSQPNTANQRRQRLNAPQHPNQQRGG